MPLWRFAFDALLLLRPSPDCRAEYAESWLIMFVVSAESDPTN